MSALKTPSSLTERYLTLKDEMRDAARLSAEAPRLLAVSKTKPIESIVAVAKLGQHEFGENYIQEACDKIRALRTSHPQLIWHCIGHIQSNKTQMVASHFDWVQTIDREKTALRLSQQRPDGMTDLQVCIQVNVSEEPNKHGTSQNAALPLAEYCAKLPGLRLRGLMAIVENTTDEINLIRSFDTMHALYEQLRKKHDGIDTLSMGMTGDWRLALQHGATLIRMGTALFGQREKV